MVEALLAGSVAIVTGTRGIGRGIAEHLAREGVAVGVVASTQDDLNNTVDGIAAEGGRALGFCADVTVGAEVSATVRGVIDEFGPPDVLVNNAGKLAGGGATLDPSFRTSRESFLSPPGVLVDLSGWRTGRQLLVDLPHVEDDLPSPLVRRGQEPADGRLLH